MKLGNIWTSIQKQIYIFVYLCRSEKEYLAWRVTPSNLLFVQYLCDVYIIITWSGWHCLQEGRERIKKRVKIGQNWWKLVKIGQIKIESYPRRLNPPLPISLMGLINKAQLVDSAQIKHKNCPIKEMLKRIIYYFVYFATGLQATSTISFSSSS